MIARVDTYSRLDRCEVFREIKMRFVSLGERDLQSVRLAEVDGRAAWRTQLNVHHSRKRTLLRISQQSPIQRCHDDLTVTINEQTTG